MEEEEIHFIDIAGQSCINIDGDTGQSKSQDQPKSSTIRQRHRKVSIVPQTVEETLNDLVKEVASAGRKKKWIITWSPLIISIFGGGLLSSSFELVKALIDKDYNRIIIWLMSFCICIGLVIYFVIKYREDIKDNENHIGIIKQCVQRIVCHSNGYSISSYYYHDKSDDIDYDRIYEKCVKGHERLQDIISPKFSVALFCLLLPSTLAAQNKSQFGFSSSTDRVGLILSVFSSLLALFLLIKMRKDEKEKKKILLYYEELIRKDNASNRKRSHRELYEQGKELFKTGNNSLAIEKITEAIALNPKQFMYYEYRADALDKMGDTDKALNDYQMALKLTNDGDNIRIIHKIAILQNELGNGMEAGLYYEKAYRILLRNDGKINNRNTDSTEIINFLNDYGNYLIQQNNLSDADEVFSRATEACNNIKEENNDSQALIAMTLINCAILHKNMFRFDEAEKETINALQKYRQLAQNRPDKYLLDVALALNNLANLHSSQYQYDAAVREYCEALKIRENVLGVDNPETAMSYNNIGNVYDSLGDYNKALEYHAKALAIRRNVFGEEHPDTAISYNNIGTVYFNLGEYEKSLGNYEKVLDIKKKVLGEDHLDTAASYNNIGSVYNSLSDHKKALEYHEKSLVIKKKLLGDEHPDIAASYNNIGNVYDSIGEYKKALEYHEKSLVIKKKLLGDEHPDTATSYNNIGSVYFALGEYNKALENHEKALSIRKKVFGEQHPDTAMSYNNIGAVYYGIGNYKKALEYHEQSLAIKKKVFGENHPDTAASYSNIGTVYFGLGEYDKSLENHEKSLAIKKEVLGEDYPDTAVSYYNIGGVYYYKGDYRKSLEYRGKAFEIYETRLGLNHPYTQQVKKMIEMTKAEMDNEK